MWRAFFLAIGATMVLMGMECLGVETINLRARQTPIRAALPFENTPKLGPHKAITPPPWAPWSLLSTGAVVCLYSFTIPRRAQGD